MRIHLIFTLLVSFSVCSADVQIITDISKGQGFLYQHKNECFVVTPSHVIEGASEIKALTASRKLYDAEVVKEFTIDLALLTLKNSKRLCKSSTFKQENKLSSLLKVYEEGVLKSKLSDGSTLQTKVDIVGVDESEYLQIKPQKNKDILKQGYSGSVLFIANQPSGILLEVDEGSGFVYRADALNSKLEEYFYPNGRKQSKTQKNINVIDEFFDGKLIPNSIVESAFIGETNSPIEFIQIPTSERTNFKLEIIDARGKVAYKNTFDSRNQNSFAFSPSKSGKYLVKATGIKSQGTFKFKVQQWVLNSQLKGEGNIVEFDAPLSSRIAYNSVAEYYFLGESNSPIEFSQIPAKKRTSFKLEIINNRGKVEYNNNFDSVQKNKFAFTPTKSGRYTVKITGTKGYGSLNFNIQQWALNSELKGEANVITFDEQLSSRIAYNAVAQYYFQAEANSPIEFSQIPSNERASFKFEILNERGRVEYKNNFDSVQKNKFAFTPIKSGKYTVKFTGIKNHGSFKFNVQQWALNSELKGQGNSVDIGDEFSSRIAYNSIAEYHFEGEANSPIEFSQIPSNERASFKFEILNERGKVEYKNNVDSAQQSRFAFTPIKSGKYTVKFTGIKNHGSFRFSLQQWSLNSELRGAGNLIEIDDQFSARIAYNSIAEYHFEGEANSPIEFSQIPTSGRTSFKLEIINKKGKVEYKSNFDSVNESKFAFTPSQTEQYTVRVTGIKNHGSFKFSLQQWALNAYLRGEGNVLEIDEQFSSRIAYNSIAEYHFEGEANSPIEFSQIPTNGRTSFKLEIINKKGKVEYKSNFDSVNESKFAFTPSQTEQYTVRITGIKNHGSFKFSLQQWALNTELRGEGNVLEIDEQFSSRIAYNSIAEYYFQGKKNSPLEFLQIPTGEQIKIKLEIINGKVVEYKKMLNSVNEHQFVFKPRTSGKYTVRVTGMKNHGSFKFNLSKGE